VLTCALAALPATASAATTRYATPDGSATDPACAAPAPCTLKHAIAVAATGDDVQLAQGDYASGPDSSCAGAVQASGIYIHGTLGRPRPRIVGATDTCTVVGLTGGSISDVEVIGNGFSKALELNAFARGYRILTGGTNGLVWVQRGSKLIDSVARAGSQSDAIDTYNSAIADLTELANVTALGRVRVVADTDDQAYLSVHNTVATGGFRIDCDASLGAVGSMTIDYFYGETTPGGCGGGTLSASNSKGSSNAELVANDWHAAPGSPLVDAGSNGYVPADANYSLDADGGPRMTDGHVDIGADELNSALPTVGAASATQLTDTGAVVTAQITPNGVGTGAYVQYGTTTSYGETSAVVPAGAGFFPGDVAIPLSGLQPSTLYHFRPVAASGSVAGDDGTFQTLPTPPPPPPGGGGTTQPPVVERILSTVRPFWIEYRRYVVLRRLKISGVPAGAGVEVRCKGRGCPFRKRSFPVRNGRANASGAVKQAKLRRRTVIQVRIVKPGAIGKVVIYKVPKKGLPKGRVRCLPPGATKPAAC
jgi:hypothetical protein